MNTILESVWSWRINEFPPPQPTALAEDLLELTDYLGVGVGEEESSVRGRDRVPEYAARAIESQQCKERSISNVYWLTPFHVRS